ncbi:MAG: hypothetical protein K0R57_1927 [Paenibacillaceae bacterium]|jgi:hypothetical protein|nr:hypothetical protein [Paenibacillaceae bacterium]
MRVPSFERYAGWMAGLGIFISGMIVGAAVFLSVYQQHLSILHERVGALTNQNKTLSDNLESLNKYKTNQQYIGKVDVIIELSPKEKDTVDINVLNEIKRRVYDDIKQISGKPVSTVRDAPDIFTDLVDRKVYRNIFEKDYMIAVRRLMVIQSDYTLYISYGEYTPSPD